MDVYLMQHGEAAAADLDPRRPLTEQGRGSVAAVAGQAAACGVRIDRIVHSGKLRARQTAEMLADALGGSAAAEVSGLAPMDPVEAAAAALIDPEASGSIAIVGHLPFLDRMASLLVTGDADDHVVAFRNGGLVRLVPAGHAGRFAVAWILVPELTTR